MNRAPRFDSRWLALRLRQLGVPSGAQLCIAFSGGADSTALLAAAAGLRRALRCRVRALHVHHHLHAAADGWARDAVRVSASLRVPARVLHVRVAAAGQSPEARARDARYAALAEALRPGECLLVAHHQEDQLETVLLQLLRGAGLPGLAAMPMRAPLGSGWLLRPALDQPRAALRAFARARGLHWSEDHSNADVRFDRNFLRQRVLPLLLQRWPAAAVTAARSAGHMAQAQQLLGELAARQLRRASDGAGLRVAALRALTAPERANALRHWLANLGLPAPDSTRLREIEVLLRARADTNPMISWTGVELRRHRGRLHAAAPAPPLPAPGEWAWRRRRRLQIEAAGSLAVVSDPHGDVALDLLPPRLQWRFRNGGERVALRVGRKSLKELLREHGIPAWQRARLPLLYAGERLIAVPGLWLAPQVRAEASTARRGRLLWRFAALG
jgi:tRNA(Ile)-lysidine synthase